MSNYGSFISIIEPFTFLKIDFNSLERGYINFLTIESTFNENNEWWRLITPMLIHFSFAHLAFNCLWIYVLGSKIELLDGNFVFVNLVIFCSISSSSGFLEFCQYFQSLGHSGDSGSCRRLQYSNLPGQKRSFESSDNFLFANATCATPRLRSHLHELRLH